MLSVFSKTELVKECKKEFKSELQKTLEKDFGLLLFLNRSRVRDAAFFFYNRRGNFINLCISDIGEKFELVYEYFFPYLKEKRFIYIITECDKKAKIDSIEIIFTQATKIENEIEKRYGLNFISLSEEAEKELYAVPAPINPIDKDLNLVPFGVYNKIHNESYYFHLFTEQDKTSGIKDNISEVVLKSGWLYRGIIPLLQQKNLFAENVTLTRRICYPGSFHHSLAYILGIEQLANIKVSERVTLLRTLFAELERCQSHLIWFSNLLYLLGFKRRAIYLLNRINDLQKLYLKYFKKRFLDELNTIGHVQDIGSKKLENLLEDIKKLLSSVFSSIYYFTYKKYVKDRCQGIGALKKEDILEAGVTGPCLRASGVNYDIRVENPYLSYMDSDLAQIWDVVTFTGSDVFSRIECRVFEFKNSYKLIEHIINKLIEDDSMVIPVDLSKTKLPGNEVSLISVESPRGELLYYLKSADRPGKTLLGGFYIATPSLKNFLALDNYILKGNDMNDLALIVHSMDLNFNEIDL